MAKDIVLQFAERAQDHGRHLVCEAGRLGGLVSAAEPQLPFIGELALGPQSREREHAQAGTLAQSADGLVSHSTLHGSHERRRDLDRAVGGGVMQPGRNQLDHRTDPARSGHRDRPESLEAAGLGHGQ